ncbi:MAG: ATP-binding protein [Pseudomonadota bacterium]
MSSLSGRLLLALSILLLLFFSITIAVLDSAFRSASEKAVADRLEIQLTGLLSAVEIDDYGGVSFPDELPEARFNNPGSGLFGEVADENGERIWRSGSLVGLGITDSHGSLSAGETHFEQLTLSDDSGVFALSLGVMWELSEVESTRLTFRVAERLEPYYAQINRFRTQLLGWFASVMLLMIAAQALFLRWALSPLRRIESEVREIEDGERAELGSGYPRELKGATQNINTLIGSERERLTRYRNTLGNLAHSLKTPLAVLRNGLSTPDMSPESAGELQKQIDRMDDIVGYQLQRAAASGSMTLGHVAVDVVTEIRAVRETLDKVYADKRPQCTLDIDDSESVQFFGDKGDLLEVLGNLLDNAYKWCKGAIQVSLKSVQKPDARRPGLSLVVEDDGPGMNVEDTRLLLERGARADETVDGQGIGLAVVKEIVNLQGGTLQLLRSSLGGAKIAIHIPPK